MRGGVETITQFGPHVVTPMFMDCNSRDHTVAFSPVPIETSIHHLMIEVDNIDDVGLAYDMVKSAGSDYPTIGRHSNDSSISFTFNRHQAGPSNTGVALRLPNLNRNIMSPKFGDMSSFPSGEMMRCL